MSRDSILVIGGREVEEFLAGREREIADVVAKLVADAAGAAGRGTVIDGFFPAIDELFV
jgi:hypothetical protein